MNSLHNGYTETQEQTNARAWRIALQSQGYAPKLNTEIEALWVAALLDGAEIVETKRIDTTPAPLNRVTRVFPSAEELSRRNVYDTTITPRDMPVIDFDSVEEIEF